MHPALEAVREVPASAAPAQHLRLDHHVLHSWTKTSSMTQRSDEHNRKQTQRPLNRQMTREMKGPFGGVEAGGAWTRPHRSPLSKFACARTRAKTPQNKRAATLSISPFLLLFRVTAGDQLTVAAHKFSARLFCVLWCFRHLAGGRVDVVLGHDIHRDIFVDVQLAHLLPSPPHSAQSLAGKQALLRGGVEGGVEGGCSIHRSVFEQRYKLRSLAQMQPAD